MKADGFWIKTIPYVMDYLFNGTLHLQQIHLIYIWLTNFEYHFKKQQQQQQKAHETNDNGLHFKRTKWMQLI